MIINFKGGIIMSSGSITTQITASNASIPVIGAYVWITQGGNLISFQETDEDGKTAPISIETPDKSESTSSGNETPFSLGDINVYHPLYEPYKIKNVQIFPGVNSLQELSLIPQPEFSPAGDNLQSVNITKQNL